jgi:hypothetical protein
MRRRWQSREGEVVRLLVRIAADDPRFDIDAIRVATRALASGLLGEHDDPREQESVIELVGGGVVDEMAAEIESGYVEGSMPWILGRSRGETARMWVGSPVRLHVVGLRVSEDSAPRVTVRVQVRVRVWPARYRTWSHATCVQLIKLPLRRALARSADPFAFWTFKLTDQGWMLLSTEMGAAGEHHLEDSLVSAPEDEIAHLQDAAINELAGADRAPAVPDEVIGNADGVTLLSRLADLSLVDERFSPTVIEASVREITREWEVIGVDPTKGPSGSSAPTHKRSCDTTAWSRRCVS